MAACSRSRRSTRTPTTGKYDYLGTKGHKIDWEMVPMGELFVEEGTLPGQDANGPHRSGWYDLAPCRPLGRNGDPPLWGHRDLGCRRTISILSRFCNSTQTSKDQYEVIKISKDHWEVTFDKIHSPGHEIGFSPDGRFLCMMNNLRENNCSVFDSGRPRSTQMEKNCSGCGSALEGEISESFPHGIFLGQFEKLYLSDSSSLARRKRNHGGRHGDLENQEGNPRHRP